MQTKQDIKIILQTKVQNKLNKSLWDSVFKKLGPELITIIRERTQEGIDIRGKAFAPYSNEYNKLTAQIYAAKREGLTEYSSTQQQPVNLRLTGNLFSGILANYRGCNISEDKVVGRFVITVNENQKGKVDGLQSSTRTAKNPNPRARKKKFVLYKKAARVFLGLSKSGNRVSLEKKRIINFIKKSVKERLIGSINIT